MSRLYSERAVLSPGSFGFATLFDALDRHVVRPVLSWHHKRITQRELMALDDRQLTDIGLSRGDLEGPAFTPNRVPSNRA